MKIRNKLILAGCLLLSGHAFGQDAPQKTEAEAKPEERKATVGVTNLAIRPTAGAIFFNGNQRFTGGVLMDFNVLSTPTAKIGPAFGALYSSVSGGDFFSGVTTSNQDYIFQIPANVKATISPDPGRRLQIGVHGGANIVRSTSTVGVFGGPTGGAAPGTNLGTTTGGSSWDAHGNVGGDIDYALGTNADLSLRPDVTFLSQFNMVTTTLGLGLKL